MTGTGQTAATKGVPMNSLRKTALIAGVLYLITIFASIPALVLKGPVLSNPATFSAPDPTRR